MAEKLYIEFDIDDAKAIHIQHLQDVITKRNKRIAELEAQLEPGAMDSEHYRRGFRDGWRKQYYATTHAADKAVTELKNLRDNTFEKYLEGERTNFDTGYELESD